MPKRSDIKKVMVIGSGPIVIGQAAEFDYAGTQACRSLREEGMQVVHAEVPQAELARYAVEMRSMTQGRGSFAMQFVRYEQVPPMIANEIIAKHQEENKEEE